MSRPLQTSSHVPFMILGLGANLGDRLANLSAALAALKKHFTWQAQSKIYASAAVDYLDQPPFFNLVAQYALPAMAPEEALQICLSIENDLGRQRIIAKGPRTIDIDLLFWDIQQINQPSLQIPHPRWSQRSFVYFPLQELPAAPILADHFPVLWQQAGQQLQIQDLQVVS